MDEKTIGANIREIRLAKKASLTETAKLAGITKSTLSKIENGQLSSPISTLLSIAKALGVHLADFVKENHPTSHAIHTPKGKGRLVVRDGTRLGYSYESLALGFPNQAAEPFLLTIRPGDSVGEFRHSGQEFIYVLSGAVRFEVGDQVYDLHQGDSLFFDATQIHRTSLLGKEPAQFLAVFIETNP